MTRVAAIAVCGMDPVGFGPQSGSKGHDAIVERADDAPRLLFAWNESRPWMSAPPASRPSPGAAWRHEGPCRPRRCHKKARTHTRAPRRRPDLESYHLRQEGLLRTRPARSTRRGARGASDLPPRRNTQERLSRRVRVPDARIRARKE